MSASDEIEYFYAAHSAFAYIGAEMLGQVAKAGGRRIVHRPMHLGTVMKAATPNSERGFTGSITLARTNYFFRREIERWAEYRGVPVMRGIPQYHYHDITLPNCLLIAAIESGADIDTLSHAVLQAHWRDDADLANAGTLHAIADGCDCDGAALLELAASPEIKAQYEKREKLFKNPDMLPEFASLQTIRSVQTSAGGQDPRFSDWFEAYDYLCGEISKVEFDVVLIGCGSYNLPLASYIKRLGKKAVVMGGSVQLLFGIRGQRWDSAGDWIEQGLYNEHWVRPSDEETPQKSSGVEGGCYW